MNPIFLQMIGRFEGIPPKNKNTSESANIHHLASAQPQTICSF